ncbi:MAG: OmpA-like transmembrane domain [Burkholderiaceae bacterium]|jgi:high affinity Mn2+ porin|nr:MAG: OmpA-like transmembrane domain [Burkholderiaceae bacterium]
MRGRRQRAVACCTLALLCGAALADAPPGSDDAAAWNLHGQATSVTQWHPSFRAPYSGANSLPPGSEHATTNDATLFLGLRPWRGGEFYLNPELDQGFGLGDTQGVAGFPSAEAYKVGDHSPYFRLQRAFLRQVFYLGGAAGPVADDANQLAGTQSADNLTITVGKFSVVDIFDTNRYAHDPRADFMNWSVVDAGAFDYAADAWGYTMGAALEWTRAWWTVRAGLFALSDTPNSPHIDTGFGQTQWVAEFEARQQAFGRPGKVKLLTFVSRGDMGSYADALALAQQTGAPPDTAQVRRRASRAGAVLNVEQELSDTLGFFARASANNGRFEAYDFTDINRSVSAGLSLQGKAWGRPDDTVGAAFVQNDLSGAARAYFAAGGLGLLIGDGQLSYGAERIAEVYYRWQPRAHLAVTFDLQHVVNPAYNRDRGPVTIAGLRLHAEF